MEKYIVLRKPLSGGHSAKRGIPATSNFSSSSGSQLKLETESVPSYALQELKMDPGVEAIAPTMPTKLIEPHESAAFQTIQETWGISAVGADTSPYTGAGVTVAVLDTGIETTHPAFNGVSLQFEDFTGSGKHDKNGHGTHCAGTIFGRDTNGQRIGVARGIQQALIGKVLTDNGGGSSEMLFHGMLWALQKNANIVSMSLGFDFPGMVKRKVDAGWPVELATSEALEAYRGNLRVFDSVMALYKARAAFGSSPLVFAAAGNESRRSVDPNFKIAASVPAASDGVISVAAALKDINGLGIADFSNSLAHLSAPGVEILSAHLEGTLKSLNGTSMACPHAAGVAALWWEKLKEENTLGISNAVRAHLESNTQNTFIEPFTSSDFGLGIVTAPQ